MSIEERLPIRVLGRNIGTATGWDGSEEQIVWYDFIPEAGIQILHPGDLNIDFTEGRFQYYNEGGDVVEEFDVIEILRVHPRA